MYIYASTDKKMEKNYDIVTNCENKAIIDRCSVGSNALKQTFPYRTPGYKGEEVKGRLSK